MPYGVLLEINPCPELFDTVKPDTDRMTQLAIDLFLTKGYRKIGFIGGAYLNPDTQRAEMDSREVIFRQTLARRDALDEAFLFSGGNFSVETGYRLAKKWWNPLVTICQRRSLWLLTPSQLVCSKR